MRRSHTRETNDEGIIGMRQLTSTEQITGAILSTILEFGIDLMSNSYRLCPVSLRAIKKNEVSISNRFPEVHKRGTHTCTHTHTHTQTHTHTHTHTHDDSIC